VSHVIAPESTNTSVEFCTEIESRSVLSRYEYFINFVTLSSVSYTTHFVL
jgi:hypothetical protein